MMVRVSVYLVFLMLYLGVAGGVYAMNLGVQGKIYEIEEIDMRLVMARDLQNVDVNKIQDTLKNGARRYTKELPQYNLPPTDHTLTQWVDPSAVLDQDITMPVKDENGNWEWRLMYPAGTEVNPLQYVKPVVRMLFFNGNSEKQVKLAIAAMKRHPYDLRLVLTEGDPAKLSKRIMAPVFYANQTLIDKFNLRFTPSLVGVGQGDKEYLLAVTEFAMPYAADVVDDAWYGLE